MSVKEQTSRKPSFRREERRDEQKEENKSISFEEEQDAAAMDEARSALSTYWSALEGTIDPSKIERATDNAVIGSVDSVSEQISERFHPDDRIMCWFDFFNHDSARVMRNMAAFMNKVAPRVNGGI